MAVYTRTGDQGESSLFDGRRVKKYDERLMAYGELDHLNVVLGKLKNKLKDTEMINILQQIQTDILDLSSFLATEDLSRLPDKVLAFDFEGRVQEFEILIDEVTKSLPELRNFILPGDSWVSVLFHEARVVCRKVERHTVELMDKQGGELRVLSYLNRLSDLLFTLARKFETE